MCFIHFNNGSISFAFQITMSILARILGLNKMASEVRAIRKNRVKKRNRGCSCGAGIRRLCCRIFGCRRPVADPEEDCRQKLANGTMESTLRDPVPSSSLEIQVTEIRKSLQRLEMRMEENDKVRKEQYLTALEWRSIASVLDRLFFIIYILLIGLSLAVFFPRPQNKEHHKEH